MVTEAHQNDSNTPFGKNFGNSPGFKPHSCEKKELNDACLSTPKSAEKTMYVRNQLLS